MQLKRRDKLDKALLAADKCKGVRIRFHVVGGVTKKEKDGRYEDVGEIGESNNFTWTSASDAQQGNTSSPNTREFPPCRYVVAR